MMLRKLLLAAASSIALASAASAAYDPQALHVVGNNAELLTVPTTAFKAVIRQGFTTKGDVEPLLYTPSSSPCSLNGGSGDNGSQVRSGDGKCWLAQFPATGIDPRQFGADPTGTNDNTTIFSAVDAAANGALVIVPKGTYKLNSNPTLGGLSAWLLSPGAVISGVGTIIAAHATTYVAGGGLSLGVALPLGSGGTGATTAAAAIASLGGPFWTSLTFPSNHPSSVGQHFASNTGIDITWGASPTTYAQWALQSTHSDGTGTITPFQVDTNANITLDATGVNGYGRVNTLTNTKFYMNNPLLNLPNLLADPTVGNAFNNNTPGIGGYLDVSAGDFLYFGDTNGVGFNVGCVGCRMKGAYGSPQVMSAGESPVLLPFTGGAIFRAQPDKYLNPTTNLTVGIPTGSGLGKAEVYGISSYTGDHAEVDIGGNTTKYGRHIADGSTTAGSTSLSSASLACGSADVGALIEGYGLGPQPGTYSTLHRYTYILSCVGGGANLSQTASSTTSPSWMVVVDPTVQDAVTSTSSPTVTSATANFNNYNTVYSNKVQVFGPCFDPGTYIQTINSNTSVTLNKNPVAQNGSINCNAGSQAMIILPPELPDTYLQVKDNGKGFSSSVAQRVDNTNDSLEDVRIFRFNGPTSFTAWTTLVTIVPSVTANAYTQGLIEITIGGDTGSVGNGVAKYLIPFDVANGVLTAGATTTVLASGSGAAQARAVVSGSTFLVQVQSSNGTGTFAGSARVKVFAPFSAGSGVIAWTLN